MVDLGKHVSCRFFSLVHCLVPENKSSALPTVDPLARHNGSYDNWWWYEHKLTYAKVPSTSLPPRVQPGDRKTATVTLRPSSGSVVVDAIVRVTGVEGIIGDTEMGNLTSIQGRRGRASEIGFP